MRAKVRLATTPILWALLGCAAGVLLLAQPAVATPHDEGGKKEGQDCVSHCDCKPGSLCTSAGKCEVQVCPELSRPVCGLDGVTYGNRCKAAVQHIVVAHEGDCEDSSYGGGGEVEEQVCGGIRGLTCPQSAFCLYKDGVCGEGDQTGVCKLRPRICTREFVPVCGCDGKTYSNRCESRVAGVSVRHAGECKKEGEGEVSEGEPG